jgi:hypothetical protein
MSGATGYRALYDAIKVVIDEINALAALRVYPAEAQRLLEERPLLLSRLWDSLLELELGDDALERHVGRLQVLVKRLWDPRFTISDSMYVTLISASA